MSRMAPLRVQVVESLARRLGRRARITVAGVVRDTDARGRASFTLPLGTVQSVQIQLIEGNTDAGYNARVYRVPIVFSWGATVLLEAPDSGMFDKSTGWMVIP